MAIPILPTDVILVIFKYISVGDLMKLRQTCKDFLAITKLRSVWDELLQTEVLQRNIPIPRLAGRDLAALDSSQLEACLIDALRLRRNWIAPSPVPLQSFTFKTVHEPQSQVVFVAFLPAKGHRYLISLVVTTSDGQRTYNLQCWDMQNFSTCIARRSFTVFRGFRVNTDPSHPGVLALRSSSGVEILAIDFLGTDPSSAFVRLQVLDDVPESLLVFSASTLLTKFDDTRLHIRTIENASFSVELRNPSDASQKECIDAIVRDKYAVIARTATLEFYSLTSFRAGTGARIIEPISIHTWQWRLDSVSLAYQPSWDAALHGLEPSLNIFARYASLFPWPVNALHHYVLPCAESYDARDAMTANNTPYRAEPVLIRTFASPIRLFARWDMTLGQYGTAIWIDSHTEDYFDHAVEGQRLAGTLFTTVEPGAEVVALNDQGVSATASMVYQVREDDGWIKIAMDEEEGRIAVGTSAAEITVFEYI
ncbi:hypothetical protein B0H15DRAFT_839481 [Mycena belliarum]|uniref:F-box domain-containing protein n=1 Tax=Mycena belliarum TaxID=1033014 RepID=A0AAD6U5W2_9AGAR|nr:hypothetical protein B0H15DRAFT_839481 [Mycena belliae]